MVASYKNTGTKYVELLFKRLKFWYKNWLLTPYGGPEFMFVSGAGPVVRTVAFCINVAHGS